ncbi:DNA-binding transcriptional MerR regulator [Streptomyces eurocidicus]|uniref:DNA-binding transcriptional MerR regulator n=1 Tax=Streptomyces eurocidicus TaxID=66423 RepID=A0A7W8BAE6_STREU|nr:DNA-binding transcriptional MerR regulator [Streptomyces eurocidicus]
MTGESGAATEPGGATELGRARELIRTGEPGRTGEAGTARQAGEYRIEDLAHRSGATVRTIRAYQDRGLLPKAERRGRANVYRDTHLARLRQISGLLDRGYTLASIKELLEAWDAGRGLGGVLGLVTEVDGPWSDETAERITRAELDRRFGGEPHDEAVDDAVELGVLVRLPGTEDAFLVPSPRELAVAVELHTAGVPLLAISGHLRELRTQVEYIAGRFLDFTTEHVFQQYFDHPPSDEAAAEAAALVRRLRPLAQQTVDAELARAMRELATRYLRHQLGAAVAAGPPEEPGEDSVADVVPRAAHPEHPWGVPTPLPRTPSDAVLDGSLDDPLGTSADAFPAGLPLLPGGSVDALPAGSSDAFSGEAADPTRESVRLPAGTVRAIRELVGEEHMETFIATAAERELLARRMDALLPGPDDT